MQVFKPVQNQKGNMTLIQVMFAALGVVATMSLITSVNNAQNLIVKQIAKDKAENLKQYVSFALSSKTNCASSLKQFFGSGKKKDSSDLIVAGGGSSKSSSGSNDSGSSQKSDPSADLNSESNSDFDLVVNQGEDDSFSVANAAGVNISALNIVYGGPSTRQNINGKNGHLGELLISVNSTADKETPSTSVTLPIYLVYNSQNQLSECFATALSPDGSSAEDSMCQMLKGQDYLYDPVAGDCIKSKNSNKKFKTAFN